MKKIWKRLGAVLLTAALALGLTAGAWAVDEDSDNAAAPFTKQATVTVSGLADGDTVHAYKLVSYDSSFNDYVFQTDFETFIGSYDGLSGSNAEEKLANCANVTKLLEDYAAAVAVGTYALPTPSAFETAANTTVSMTLEPGYYLLLAGTTAGNSKVYQPMSVFAKVEGDKIIVYGGGDDRNGQENALSINVKSEDGPVIDKKVNATRGAGKAIEWRTTAAAGIGETAKFYVQVTIPYYQNITTMQMQLHDTMTAMAYTDGSMKVYTEGPDANGDIDDRKLLGVDGAVVENPGTYTDGKQELTFTLDYAKIMDSAQAAKNIWIYYEAVVQPDAANGTDVHSAANEAYLTYTTAVGNSQSTDRKRTTVYNYEFKLNKRTENQATSLAGAGFTLYSDENCTQPISFVKTGEYYRPAVGTEAGAVKEITADFLLIGLDANTYYVKETTTPNGYFQPEGAFQLVLTSDMEGQILSDSLDGSKCDFAALAEADHSLIAEKTVNLKDHSWRFVVTLKNNSTPLLPTTGGPGTVAISIAGVLLMILGAALYMGYRKKRAQN